MVRRLKQISTIIPIRQPHVLPRLQEKHSRQELSLPRLSRSA